MQPGQGPGRRICGVQAFCGAKPWGGRAPPGRPKSNQGPPQGWRPCGAEEAGELRRGDRLHGEGQRLIIKTAQERVRKHPLRLLYLAVALGPRPRFPTEKNLKRTGHSTLLPVMAHGGPIPKHILPQSELWDLSRHWTTGRPVQNGRTLSNVPIQRTKTGKANIESRFGSLYNRDNFTDRGEGSPLLTVWESCAPCPRFK